MSRKTIKVDEETFERVRMEAEKRGIPLSKCASFMLSAYNPERLGELEEELSALQAELNEKDAELSALRLEIGTKDGDLEMENVRLTQEVAGLEERVIELEKEKEDLEETLEDAARRWMEEHPSTEEPQPDPAMEWIKENDLYYPPMGKRSRTPEEYRWLFTNAERWMEKWPPDALDMMTVEEREGIMTELWLKGKFKEHGDPPEGYYDTQTWEFHVGRAPKKNDRFMRISK